MKSCKVDENKSHCTCTYTSCSRHGVCCECIAYHRKSDQLPACYFPADVESRGERSIEAFIKVYQERGDFR